MIVPSESTDRGNVKDILYLRIIGLSWQNQSYQDIDSNASIVLLFRRFTLLHMTAAGKIASTLSSWF